MKVRYTYFKAQPRGYCVFDEVFNMSVAFYESAKEAISCVLRLNIGNNYNGII